MEQKPWDKRKNDMRKLVNDRAQELLSKKMRAICKRDKSLYNSLFAYPIIRSFARTEGLFPANIILLLLLDIYKNFRLDDANMWDLAKDKYYFYKIKQGLRDKGYIEHEKSNCYLTLQGREAIKRFNDFYNDHVTKVLKKNGTGDEESIRKIIRAKPAREYKPRNRTTG